MITLFVEVFSLTIYSQARLSWCDGKTAGTKTAHNRKVVGSNRRFDYYNLIGLRFKFNSKEKSKQVIFDKKCELLPEVTFNTISRGYILLSFLFCYFKLKKIKTYLTVELQHSTTMDFELTFLN